MARVRADAIRKRARPTPEARLFLVGGGLDVRVRSRRGLGVRARSHRNDYIVTLFAVEIFDAQLHVVLFDAELSPFADGQKGRVFIVLGADAVVDTVGLQLIFLAQ